MSIEHPGRSRDPNQPAKLIVEASILSTLGIT
jgi:hypothetical protein